MRCPRGHTLGPNQVLAGHQACLGHRAGHTTWTRRACDQTVYGPPLNSHCTTLEGLAFASPRNGTEKQAADNSDMGQTLATGAEDADEDDADTFPRSYIEPLRAPRRSPPAATSGAATLRSRIDHWLSWVAGEGWHVQIRTC